MVQGLSTPTIYTNVRTVVSSTASTNVSDDRSTLSTCSSVRCPIHTRRIPERQLPQAYGRLLDQTQLNSGRSAASLLAKTQQLRCTVLDDDQRHKDAVSAPGPRLDCCCPGPVGDRSDAMGRNRQPLPTSILIQYLDAWGSRSCMMYELFSRDSTRISISG